MKNVAALAVAEPVSVDERRLQDIVNELGEVAAEGLIQLALEQMALAVHALQADARSGNNFATVEQAQRLSRLAWQVGLVSLAGVAVDVGSCAERQDRTALAATSARLHRIGNRSLTEIWEAPGYR